MSQPTKKPHVLSEKFREPDLVDRIFDYIVEQLPELSERADEVKEAVREEFAGIETYIQKRRDVTRQKLAIQVLSLFNGRNVSEVARKTGTSRATVYRLLRQAGEPAKE